MTQTATEKKREHQREIDQLDLDSVNALIAIFERPEVQQALADIQALGDPDDIGAVHRSPGADFNALAANAALPFTNVPAIGALMRTSLEQKLGLTPTADQVPQAPLPPTE